MKAIRVENLTYRYPRGKDYALKNVNVSIDEGEFVLIVGPSGSGKSTFVRLLNGLIPHYYGGELEGNVYIYNINTRDSTVANLSQIVGIVFQDPENQLLTLTVEREIAFGPENLGLPPSEILLRVEDSLKKLGIEHLRFRLPFELSGGEQQRVVVASVLAMKPKILVFDEPTSNMDPLSAYRFIKLLKSLHDLGYTIIVVEHRLDMLVPMVSRIIVFDKGHIVADGDVDTILNSYILEEVGVDYPRIPLLFKILEERLNIKLGRPREIDDAIEVLKVIVYGRSH